MNLDIYRDPTVSHTLSQGEGSSISSSSPPSSHRLVPSPSSFLRTATASCSVTSPPSRSSECNLRSLRRATFEASIAQPSKQQPSRPSKPPSAALSPSVSLGNNLCYRWLMYISRCNPIRWLHIFIIMTISSSCFIDSNSNVTSSSSNPTEIVKGIQCKQVARSIDSVGLYVLGGTAVLPSTALMLSIIYIRL
ncbi:hypothetical protein Ahy_Scaffold1g107039 [Arachis hypogaea]|uniref:Uncharacterized protein n=1 Tax=Arachis hypogaea TaxID=3818 RepID=A0A444WUA5_ARAHY|nr:hypothetical protein Ahy_Scaffold1g107039 [Arachis hypogaea]